MPDEKIEQQEQAQAPEEKKEPKYEIVATPADQTAAPVETEENVEDKGEPTPSEVAQLAAENQKRVRPRRDHQARIDELTRDKYELKSQISLREQQLQDIVQKAAQVEAYNRYLQAQVTQGTGVFVENAIQKYDAQISAAKERYRQARELGNMDAELKAQEDMATAAAERAQWLSRRPPQQTTTQQNNNAGWQNQPQPQQPYYQQPQPAAPAMDARVAQWVEKNPQLRDPDIWQFAVGREKELEARGIKPGTDEYFQAMESRLQAAYPEAQFQSILPPRAPNNVAGGSRASAASGVTQKIQIPQASVDFARKYGIPEERLILSARQLKERGE